MKLVAKLLQPALKILEAAITVIGPQTEAWIEPDSLHPQQPLCGLTGTGFSGCAPTTPSVVGERSARRRSIESLSSSAMAERPEAGSSFASNDLRVRLC
jgi:hypothetical protein